MSWFHSSKLFLFLCRTLDYFFLGDEVLPVIFRETPSSFISTRWWRRDSGEEYLGDLHPGTQDDGNIVLIRYFKSDTQEVARIYDTRRVVNHKADAGERGLTAKLDEIIIRTEEFFRDTENRRAGVEDELLSFCYFYLATRREEFFLWIYDACLCIFVKNEFVPEPNIVTHGLEL